MISQALAFILEISYVHRCSDHVALRFRPRSFSRVPGDFASAAALSDDVVGPSCVTHQGQVVNSRVAASLKVSVNE